MLIKVLEIILMDLLKIFTYKAALGGDTGQLRRTVPYILKAKKFAESAFQSQKNLRKKCVNLDIKISRQKCVNQ